MSDCGEVVENGVRNKQRRAKAGFLPLDGRAAIQSQSNGRNAKLMASPCWAGADHGARRDHERCWSLSTNGFEAVWPRRH